MNEPIGVIGLGMVGGTVSTAFTEAGVAVRGYDPYLGIGAPKDLRECGVVFLCAPTPSDPRHGYDLTEIWSATHAVAPFLQTGAIVAVKSTVPPGTNDSLASAYERLEFASLPEFLIASKPLETFTHPDRIVIGARSHATAELLRDVLSRVAPQAPVLFLQPIEAEVAKLCSNALLSAKVAMSNELFDVCSSVGVSWARIQAVAGLDRRIGPDHLTVTEERGFGGTCLPKDLDGLIAVAEDNGYTPSLLNEVATYNRRVRAQAKALSPRTGLPPTQNGRRAASRKLMTHNGLRRT